MKKLKNIFIIFSICICVSSCCTKKYCGEANFIEFIGFSQTDLDTIILYTYAKNTNLILPLDSFQTQGESFGLDTTKVQAYTNKVDFDRDYKIIIVSTGQIFALTDLETERKGCNSCFPYRPRSDYYRQLKSYKVNGETIFKHYINIYN